MAVASMMTCNIGLIWRHMKTLFSITIHQYVISLRDYGIVFSQAIVLIVYNFRSTLLEILVSVWSSLTSLLQNIHEIWNGILQTCYFSIPHCDHSIGWTLSFTVWFYEAWMTCLGWFDIVFLQKAFCKTGNYNWPVWD